TAPSLRATSFRTARSVSIRRIMAAISDLPAGGETSPSIKGSRSLQRQDSVTTHDDHSS
nr:transmembrane protein [Tanacetum cinerariifolium]